MSRQAINWIVILVVTLVGVINPWYRHFTLHQPIVTLGLDLRGGVEVLLRAVPEVEEGGTRRQPTKEEITGVLEIVANRIDPQGAKEIVVSSVGSDRVIVQVPGEKDPDSVIKVIGQTALMEWVDCGNEYFAEGTDFNMPGSTERKPEFAKYQTILKGDQLKNAFVTTDEYGKPAVGFTFKPEGAEIFGRHTTSHVDQYLAVLLDGKVVTCPVIQGAIWGGNGIINGSFTMDEADRLVRQLNAGALPVPLEILSSSVVGPTLGQESIDASLKAGLAGFLLVLLFLLIVYRLPGFVAAIALTLYVIIVIGYMSLINATMTLPGIAGFLLSIGMAIDGNIIIFERFKEELRWGKTLVAAHEAAFSRAWAAILDGNLVTMIAAAVLYFNGTGPVKGFAVTLFIGNIVALFSAVFVTRSIMEIVVRLFKNTALFAAPVKQWYLPAEILQRGLYYRYIERTRLWLGISFTVLAAFVIMGAVQASRSGSIFNLGLDYTGGEQLRLRSTQEFALDGQDVAAIVAKYSEGEPVVQVDLTDPHIVNIRLKVKAEGADEKEQASNRALILADMKKEIGDAFGGFVAATEAAPNPEVLQQDYVGPTVGQELINKAIVALVIGCLLIIVYIFVRFASWPMGISGILGVLHDVLLTLAAASAFQLEINASFIAVILTIVGYSINDKVIVYDRIRENLRTLGDSVPFAQLCNLSISQVILRSMNTVFSVILTILALLLFGGSNIRDFMIAMLVGMISAGYSSIYISTPIMQWFTSSRGTETAPPAAAVAAAGGGSVASVTLPMRAAGEDDGAAGAAGGSSPRKAKKQARRR